MSEIAVIDGLPNAHLGTARPLMFRVVLNPRRYPNCHDVSVLLLDNSDTEVSREISRWGTKMTVTASFSDRNSEGIVRVFVIDGQRREIARLWFVR